jgi:hypothetical protein
VQVRGDCWLSLRSVRWGVSVLAAKGGPQEASAAAIAVACAVIRRLRLRAALKISFDTPVRN